MASASNDYGLSDRLSSNSKKVSLSIVEETTLQDDQKPQLNRSSTQKSWVSHFQTGDHLLEVSRAKFSVKTKAGMKDILKDVSFAVKGGQLLSLMGPSGAGKTTLLEYVNLNLKGGRTSGCITLDGKPLSVDIFKEHAAYVEQYDTHWAFLTTREILNYAMKLASKSDEESMLLIMKQLGLMECADTKAGNIFLKGLSGGQKKRLSLAIALLKGPTLLLLDEPTSGLDAASTKAVMSYLLELASQAGTIIIATIHQPATEVFMSFSKVMFLANGRLAFLDSTSKVEPYVQSIGRPMLVNTNPSDHFLSLINSEFVDRTEVDKVVNEWSVRGKAFAPSKKSFQELPLVPKMSELAQSVLLLRRHFLLSIRDPTLYVGRMIVFLLANAFFAIIYVKARDRQQKYAPGRFFLINWFLAATSMFNVVVVYAVNEEFRMIQKDVRNGMCRRGAYLLSKFLLQVPYMIILALFAIAIPGYAIFNFRPGGFLLITLVMATVLWSYECVAEALAVAVANPLIGMLGAVSFWFAGFLFSGAFLQPEFIIWPFRAFTYLFPLRWAIQAMNYLEFHDTEWEGAKPSANAPGFYCPSAGPCFGYTGDQVRASLSQTFGCVSADDTVGGDIRNILLVGIFFKLVAVVLVITRTELGFMKLTNTPSEGSQSSSTPPKQIEKTEGDIEAPTEADEDYTTEI